MRIDLTINGVRKSLEVRVNEVLLDVLRREGYYSVKHGCETGECGACAVFIEGVPRNSCIILAPQVHGRSLLTLEGLGSPKNLHPLQRAFVETGAIQCGFCIPGMIIVAKALLDANPHPTEEEVREALSGNLCRCTGYRKPVQAVLLASGQAR